MLEVDLSRSSNMPRNDKKLILPPMPFGQSRAKVYNDVREFTDAVSAAVDNQFYFDSIGNEQPFHLAAASVNLNGTHLVASVSTPTHYRVGESNQLYLLVPFHGASTARVRDHHPPFEGVRDVFLSPNIPRSGENSTAAMVQTMLDAGRLLTTARTMLGDPAAAAIRSYLQYPNVLPYRQGRIRYDHIFKRLCQTIDDLHLDETLLALQGIDDSLYRTLVMMLLPEFCLKSHNPPPPPVSTQAAILHVCDYARAHLQEPITLTQLEDVSGLTARSLRYAFQKRFGCSPLQWVAQQRLEKAHHLLTLAGPTDTVTRVAYACGITRLGMFAQAYAQRFGERPSETLARALRR